MLTNFGAVGEKLVQLSDEQPQLFHAEEVGTAINNKNQSSLEINN